MVLVSPMALRFLLEWGSTSQILLLPSSVPPCAASCFCELCAANVRLVVRIVVRQKASLQKRLQVLEDLGCCDFALLCHE